MKPVHARLLSAFLIVSAAPFAVLATEANPGSQDEHRATITVRGVRGAEDVSSSVATIGDVPHHQFSQRVYTYTLSSTDAPDFDGATTMNFVQADSTEGQGKHSGYAVWTLRNGDIVRMEFSGQHSRMAKGTTLAPNHGTLQLVSGTGKYSRIKGEGTYTGSTSAEGGNFDATVQITY